MIPALIAALLPIVQQVVEHIPDPNAREQAQRTAEQKLLEAVQLQNTQQVELNKIEAANNNLFVAGWRPFIGWVCGFALWYQYIAMPLLSWVCALLWPAVTLPIINGDYLFELVLALLGLGGLRTYEKIKLKK